MATLVPKRRNRGEPIPAEALAALGAGRLVLLLDLTRDRGDFLAAADKIGCEAVNTMIREGRGLVAVAIDPAQRRKLALPTMPGSDALSTVEARSGVTTGISAADRARTIRVVTDPDSTPEDVVCPGHVVAFEAAAGGLLARDGRAEAAIDAVRLAGSRAAALCEVLDEDGELADCAKIRVLAERLGCPRLTVDAVREARVDEAW